MAPRHTVCVGTSGTKASVWITRGITRQPPLIPPLAGKGAGSLSVHLSPPSPVSSTLESFPRAFVVFSLFFSCRGVGKFPTVLGLIRAQWWKHKGGEQFFWAVSQQDKDLTFPPRMILHADSQARWGEASWAAPSLPPGHLCFRLGPLHHPSPLPCRVPTLWPSHSHTSHRTMNHSKLSIQSHTHTHPRWPQELRVTLSSSLGPTACLSPAPSPQPPFWQHQGWVLGPSIPRAQVDPGGLDTILYPNFLQQQLTAPPSPRPQENQAAEDLGSAATSPAQAVVLPSVLEPHLLGCHADSVCVWRNSCAFLSHFLFPASWWACKGLQGSCVGLGFSLALLPWARQRAGLPLGLRVTQGLAESVLRMEILAKGGQGPEQTAALLLRCLTGRWSRVTGDLGEAQGSQGPTPGEKRVDLALIFFP